MGTHPIFESDFDCLTEIRNDNRQRSLKMTMQCPFVKSVSRGLFKQSDVTLKEAITACPFMQRRKFEIEIKPPQPITTQHKILKQNDLRCPYTSGSKTKGSVCPLTSIDVKRAAHSEVLQSIDKTTPVKTTFEMSAIKKAIEDEHRDRVDNSSKEEISSLIRKKKSNNTYREFKRINKKTDDPGRVDEVLNFKAFTDVKEIFCSNDYLNMSAHPKVVETVSKTARIHGVGAGGTRNISGNSELTEFLEAEIADWHDKDDALLFPSCYTANHETLSTLLGKLFPNSQCFSDSGNH